MFVAVCESIAYEYATVIDVVDVYGWNSSNMADKVQAAINSGGNRTILIKNQSGATWYFDREVRINNSNIEIYIEEGVTIKALDTTYYQTDAAENLFEAIDKNNISIRGADDSSAVVLEMRQDLYEDCANNNYSCGEWRTGISIKGCNDIIIENLKDLNVDEYSAPLKINNNYFIFKINDIRKIEIEIDKKKELDKMIFVETSKQLDKFSNIFYNKIKLNSEISEF